MNETLGFEAEQVRKRSLNPDQVCMSRMIMIQVSILGALLVGVSVGVAIFLQVKARRKRVRSEDIPCAMWRFDSVGTNGDRAQRALNRTQ